MELQLKRCPFRTNHTNNNLLNCDTDCALYSHKGAGCFFANLNTNIAELSKKIDILSDTILSSPKD